MMNIEFHSQEMRGDYPRVWNQPKIQCHFSETEQLMIERSHHRMVERSKTEKLSPRERAWGTIYGHDPIDYIPMEVPYSPNAANRVLDSFIESPSIITNKDLYDYPNLNFLSLALFFARIPSDSLFLLVQSYGEEQLTSKFRLVDHGPPLAVEGIAQTADAVEAKANLEFFMDNLPDPANRGLFPLNLWITKQSIKTFPEFLVRGCCCAGSIASASFLRGPKEFLLDVRKRPELANLAITCGTKYLLRKLDRMIEAIGEPFDIDNKNGNALWWCDGGGGYLTLEEFKRTYDLHFGISVPYCAKKGFPPFVATVAGGPATQVVAKTIEEQIGGGGIMVGTGVPPIDEGFEIMERRDKTLDRLYMDGAVGVKLFLAGEEPTRKWFKDFASYCAKTPEKGLRWEIFTSSLDPHLPLPNLDMLCRVHRETMNYPVTG